MTKTASREQRVHQKLEQAAKAADRGTRPGREESARLVTQANSIKAGRPVPSWAKGKR